MIQMQTVLDAAGNSGARRVQCIKVLGAQSDDMQVLVMSSKSVSRMQFLAARLRKVKSIMQLWFELVKVFVEKMDL